MPMLISAAYAQGTGITGIFDNQSALIQFLPLVLIFVVFYFLLIRPQQRKAKDHKTMLDALRRGDRVVTGGGIIGTVARARSRVCSPSRTRPRRAKRQSKGRRLGRRLKQRTNLLLPLRKLMACFISRTGKSL
jgi:preprotein translocase YajC subunit